MRSTLWILLVVLGAGSAHAHDWNGIAIDAQDHVYVADGKVRLFATVPSVSRWREPAPKPKKKKP